MTSSEPSSSEMPPEWDSESLIYAAKVLKALRTKKTALYLPYPKQAEFHQLGISNRERLMLAGNQLGKTKSAAEECGFHLTGLYPEWWVGRRFPGPTRCWVANTNNETVRDAPQLLLMGEAKDWGTGTIPRSSIAKDPVMSRGFPDLIDTVQIKHVSGGVSSMQFKAYDQGRKKFQGASLDFLWLDEEPPIDVYTECLARLTARGGMLFMTMTPLLGISDVVTLFFPEPTTPWRSLTMMDISEAGHFDEEERAMIIASYPAHERDARSRGLPMLGSGRIFDLPRESIECQAFDVPRHYFQLGGVDFGYGDHPFAAVKVLHDREADILYLTNCYKEQEPKPAIHASAVRDWGYGLRWAYPHDGSRQWGDSGPVKDVYRAEGMRMLAEHSTFRTGGYSTEAAVQLLLSRMQTGRFKAFAHLDQFWSEVSMYHRKDGLIVKQRDDLLSALYKTVMMLRYARVPDDGARVYAPEVIHDW